MISSRKGRKLFLFYLFVLFVANVGFFCSGAEEERQAEEMPTLEIEAPPSAEQVKETDDTIKEESETTQKESAYKNEDVRLPELALPLHYDLMIKPDLKTFTFDGHVSIRLQVLKPTDVLSLHASQLDILGVSGNLADGTSFLLNNNTESAGGSWKLDTEGTFLHVHLPSGFLSGETLLNITYRGEINDKMRGFSRSSYKSNGNGTGTERKFLASTKFEEGEKNCTTESSIQYLASTQFESTYARKAFPCWDEPVYKARFSVVLDVDASLTAISNMPVIAEEPSESGNRKLVKFDETPLMSSYLVAWAVGDFEYIETQTNGGVRVRVYTVPGKSRDGQYALEIAKKCLDWYNEWFGYKMPLPKTDLIAIPDFSSGAMENWGMVTYREVLLLMDPARSSTFAKMRIAQVIAHELAHFWFGNLVSMKWWTDLWLKEGFASFMEYMFVGTNMPEMKIWPKFLTLEMAGGFGEDSLRNSHPIEVPIHSPKELDEIYDAITYEKSNSVIRMLFEHLGEATFQKGLQIYLNRHQYNNAVTQDLWTALSEASGQDINALMSSWTKQQGFPLVMVEQRTVDNDHKSLFLRQERYLLDGKPESSINESLWQIPVGVAVSGHPMAYKFLLKERTGNFLLDELPKSVEWIKLNSRTSGFYRVQYPDDMLQPLLQAFRPSKDGSDQTSLDVMDRYGIASDLFSMVETGRTPVGRFLDLFAHAAAIGEDNYVVWTALNGGIGQLSSVMDCADSDGNLHARLLHFVATHIAPVSELLGGWNSTVSASSGDSDRGPLQAMMLRRLIRANHQPAVEKATQLFREHVDKGAAFFPDFRPVIFTAVALSNDDKAISDLKHILETVNFSEVERNAIVALGQVTDAEKLAEIFKYGVLEGKIRPQDICSLFYGASTSRVGRRFGWNFLKENKKLLLDMFESATSSLFQRCFSEATESMCTEEDAQDVERFIAEGFDDATKRAVQRKFARIVERIRINANIVEKNKAALDQYLSSNGF